jgi:MoxR-like ATPase
MFDSVQKLSAKLAATGYFIDPVMTMDIFLAGKLRKPLILEGPAGSGKTQLALAVAQAANTHIERLQCYEGLTDKQAIGEFDEGLQRLYMEFCKGQGLGWHEIVQTLKGRDFFRPGPLMRALECERPCVLLIDEIDKVDEAKEALLLEPLSAYQLSIPEFGTVEAKSIPFVVVTSNEERHLGDSWMSSSPEAGQPSVAMLLPSIQNAGQKPWASGTRIFASMRPYRMLNIPSDFRRAEV